MSSEPYFSIGVTTYKRGNLLAETLASVLAQSFDDFEVIVGNDDPDTPLSSGILGIDDPRLRIVNHAANLGEMANMNALLHLGRGRYFTWLADDDLYAPNFLQAVHDCHTRFGPLDCVFTGYASGSRHQLAAVEYAQSIKLTTGRDHLRDYLARRIRILGCYGVFETRYLRTSGGMQQLGRGFSPYSDNLLAIQAGLLEHLCFVDAPLIFFRTHPDSLSFGSTDLNAYLTAQDDLCARAIEVLEAPALEDDFRANLYNLLSHWCLAFTFSVLRRSPDRPRGWLPAYMRFLNARSSKLGLCRLRLAAAVLPLFLKHFLFKLRNAFKP